MKPQLTDIRGPDLEASFETLLNLCFEVPENRRFFEDFPVWSEGSGLRLVRRGIIDGEGRIVAAAAGRRVRIRTPGELLEAGVVGAVATHPDFRGKGYASELVSSIVGDLRLQGAALVLLWGSEHSLYSKLGFDLCGVQAKIPLDDLDMGEIARWPGTIETGWRPEIFQMMRKRRGGAELGPADEKWISAHRGVEWMAAKRNGRFEAYLGIGRGIDLTDVIHEWGGNPSTLRCVLRELSESRPELSFLGSPFILGDWGVPFGEEHLEYLCLGKVLDPVQVIQAFRPDARVSGAFMRPTGWDLEIEGQRFSAVDEKELPKLLFGPEQIRDIQSSVLPLPLWVWGLDAG